MRRTYFILAALLSASLAAAGCASRQPDQPATNAAAPLASATTVAPTTAAPSPQAPAAQQPDVPAPDTTGALPWGTGPKRVDAPPVSAEIYNVRVAGHDRYDRVVFDVNGLAHLGYAVRYVPGVHADPSDKPIPVAGGAALQVTIQAPDFASAGHQPWRTPWQLGQRLAGGQTVLREVRFAGSFEHVTTFAVGVGAKRPFRVLVLPDSGNHVTRVVVDVAR
jgi:outer membrane murein-binding lipoprotein Lpp